MSEPVTTEKHTSTPREHMRVRISKLRQSRSAGMFGLAEIIGLAGSALMLLALVFAYFFFLVPARTRLDSLQLERARLQKQLTASQEGVQREMSTEATVAKINESLENFENNHLAGRNEGRMALYNNLNLLIRRNAVRNTAGPAYVPLDALANTPGASTASQQIASTASKTGNARFQSIFPGIGVNLTVEGQYQNLRRFLRDIEASNQFLIINSVDLESVTDTNAPRVTNQPSRATGSPDARGASTIAPATRATLVSLRLNLAAYFQRGANTTAPAPSTGTR